MFCCRFQTLQKTREHSRSTSEGNLFILQKVYFKEKRKHRVFENPKMADAMRSEQM